MCMSHFSNCMKCLKVYSMKKCKDTNIETLVICLFFFYKMKILLQYRICVYYTAFEIANVCVKHNAPLLFGLDPYILYLEF